MTGGVVSPKTYTNVAQSKGIAVYRIYHQPATQLANGVCTSENLQDLYFPHTGISEKEGGGDITIASNVISNFESYSNGHNVVDMSNKSSLTKYFQQFSSGGSTASSRAIGSKFAGCTSLQRLDFYSSSVTGNIGTIFTSLPALTYLELRRTSVSGQLFDDSFANTNSLQNFYVEGTAINTADYFGTQDSIDNNSGSGEVFKNTPDMRWIYCYNNRNIRGKLPDFSSNFALTGLYFYGTGLNGPIQTFANCTSLYYLNLTNNAFTGAVPAFTGNGLKYIYLSSNQLAGQIPSFTTPYLYQLQLQYNNFSGNVPDMSGCTRLQRVYLNNNNINGYVPGALQYNSSLSIVDFSNNQLPNTAGSNIIADLFENYSLNPRRGVSVNLLGNPMSRSGIENDGTDGDSSTANKLSFLENFWTILI